MSNRHIKRALTRSASLLGWWNAGYEKRLPQHVKRVAAATITGKILSNLFRGSR